MRRKCGGLVIIEVLTRQASLEPSEMREAVRSRKMFEVPETPSRAGLELAVVRAQ